MKQEVLLTLGEAKECLEDARIMLDKQRWKTTVSRSYYAMFNTAKAALVSIDNKAFTHQGVNIQFSKQFIKTGIFEKHLITAFSKMLDARLKADYEIGFKATEEDAKNAIKDAENFYSEIEKYLKLNE